MLRVWQLAYVEFENNAYLVQDLTHGFEALDAINSSPWWEFSKPETEPPHLKC